MDSNGFHISNFVICLHNVQNFEYYSDQINYIEKFKTCYNFDFYIFTDQILSYIQEYAKCYQFMLKILTKEKYPNEYEIINLILVKNTQIYAYVKSQETFFDNKFFIKLHNIKDIIDNDDNLIFYVKNFKSIYNQKKFAYLSKFLADKVKKELQTNYEVYKQINSKEHDSNVKNCTTDIIFEISKINNQILQNICTTKTK